MPYKDGEALRYTCGYCKHAEIEAREQEHVASDGKDYVGEARAIKMTRRSQSRGDWGMLVAGEYDDVEPLSKKDVKSAIKFVSRQSSCHKPAYWVSPERDSPTKSKWDGIQLSECPVCHSGHLGIDVETSSRYRCGSCGFTSNAGKPIDGKVKWKWN